MLVIPSEAEIQVGGLDWTTASARGLMPNVQGKLELQFGTAIYGVTIDTIPVKGKSK